MLNYLTTPSRTGNKFISTSKHIGELLLFRGSPICLDVDIHLVPVIEGVVK